MQCVLETEVLVDLLVDLSVEPRHEVGAEVAQGLIQEEALRLEDAEGVAREVAEQLLRKGAG